MKSAMLKEFILLVLGLTPRAATHPAGAETTSAEETGVENSVSGLLLKEH